MKKILISYVLCFVFSNILYSQTWTELTSNTTNSLYSVSAVDDHNVWVCGASGTVLRSNNGTSWQSVGSAPISNTLALYNIFGIDSLTALVTGSSSTATFVYRTSNGGANWIQVFTQSGGFIDAILMGNAQAGFMVGDPVGGRWSLWGTITGGVTWDSAQFRLPQSGSEAGWNNSFYFDNISQAVWFGTNNSRIYRSTNLIIWGTEPTTGEVNSSALWFTSSSNGMMGGDSVLLTTNSGAVWTPTASLMPGTAVITGISGIGTNWWVVRQASVVYSTPNNGANWSVSYTAPAGNYNHISQSRGGSPTLYAVRDNGGISKATNLLVNVIPVSNNIPKEYSLKQNYPNPFNPATIISYALPFSTDVNLKVYDELGKEVMTLVNGKQNAGKYEVRFDGSGLASGLYFYTLQAGTFSQTKKLMLIK
jgi:photosystem II stability/assembly factor-like uncharacterized protein